MKLRRKEIHKKEKQKKISKIMIIMGNIEKKKNK